MSVVATVAVPAESFPLDTVLELDPETDLSVGAIVPTTDRLVAYLWIPDETESVTDRLEATPVVATATVVDEVDGTLLVRIAWTDRATGLFESIRRASASVIGASGTGEHVTFRMRFPSYDSLSTFYAACCARDVDVELLELHEPVTPGKRRRYGLTSGQRELVLAAHEAGYFDVPRGTTLVELGEELEISDSAVSQRLRRGLAALIESTLVADTGSERARDSVAEIVDGGGYRGDGPSTGGEPDTAADDEAEDTGDQ